MEEDYLVEMSENVRNSLKRLSKEYAGKIGAHLSLLDNLNKGEVPLLFYFRERISPQRFQDFRYSKSGSLEELLPQAMKAFEYQKSEGFLESLQIFLNLGEGSVLKIPDIYYKDFLSRS